MFPKFLCLFVLASIAIYSTEASPVQSWWPFSSGSSNKNLNWVLDAILKSVSSELIAEHGDEMEIPVSQIDASQSVQILWWNSNGQAKSDAPGILKNISSVVRVSDAVIAQTTASGTTQIDLKAELKLNDLEMVYSSVNAKFSIFSYNAGLTVKCPENGFNVEVLMTSGSSCSAQLKAASITELGCSVVLDEGGIINYFKKHIFSYALGKVIDDVKTTLTSQLPAILTPIIEKHNICKFLEPSSV